VRTLSNTQLVEVKSVNPLGLKGLTNVLIDQVISLDQRKL